MSSSGYFKTLHNFALDGSKILFGSLVVGVFMPNTAGEIPWGTFAFGMIATAFSLGIALLLSRRSFELHR